MISRRSYWAKWLENIKRRGWTFVLCAAVMLLLGPVFLSVNLTGLYNGGAFGSQTSEEMDLMMRTAFVSHIGFSQIWVFPALFFAVLFAVQGFCWLYSRQKMDLYMSVPVSSVKRYVMIWGNGIVCYAGLSFTGLLLCWATGAVFGVMSCYAAAQSMAAWAFQMLAFLAMYHVSLVAVMLTGNVLTALLGCVVLFSYEPAMRILYNHLKTMFYYSYCSADAERMMRLPWLSPFAGTLDLFERVCYRDGYLVGVPGTGGLTWQFGIQTGLLVICAASAGIFAYWLYRKRKTESYHRSVAFSPLAAVLELALLVPFGMAAGMAVAKMSGDSGIFLFGGCLLGTVCGHAMIRLVYKRELKEVLGGKAVFAVSLTAAACFLGLFRFDWTGYDSYIPASREVRAVSVSLESDYSAFGNYEEPLWESGSVDMEEELLEKMASENTETIESVLWLAKKWRDKGMPGTVRDFEAGADTGYISEGEGKNENLRRWVVCYTMQGGRKVYRRFFADMEADQDKIDIIMKDPSYQRVRYQIFSPMFEERLGEMKISFADGRTETLYTAEKGELLEALRTDFRQYGYSLISDSIPEGKICFELKNKEGGQDSTRIWEYPLYKSFEKTGEVLARNGIEVRDWQTLYCADEVDEIRISYYHYEGKNKGLFEGEKLPEQEITAVFTDRDQVEELLKALYSEELSWIAGEEFGTVDRDDRYTVQIFLSEEGRKAREKDPTLCLIRSLEPEFVERTIRERAVYE
ncbi:MAG: DUF6449 domain-containing protein [Eisenbergiella sp.]